ncbi:helix-turn-helix domain-containing protein [Bradyrhizobium paxllaeri]|uniref:helix-turn-helix domain-containing protein n=1 Tax=Bradyrhizobium paxllaeri TaxID=190148 RepID=UPI0011466131|nr:helix-turn-helix domain-containing protein [Bradyrhizobium paxllaeri]
MERLKKKLNLHDTKLAELVGVDQSSVHRALNRKPPRLTPTLEKLCNYAKKRLSVDGSQLADNGKEQLAKAVAGVWDGSPAGLNKLLTLLRDLGDLVTRD